MEQMLNKINKPELEPINDKNKLINDGKRDSGKRDYKSYTSDFIGKV